MSMRDSLLTVNYLQECYRLVDLGILTLQAVPLACVEDVSLNRMIAVHQGQLVSMSRSIYISLCFHEEFDVEGFWLWSRC